MTKCWLIPFLMAGLLGDKAFADCLPAQDTPASVIEYFHKFNKPLPEKFCTKEAPAPPEAPQGSSQTEEAPDRYGDDGGPGDGPFSQYEGDLRGGYESDQGRGYDRDQAGRYERDQQGGFERGGGYEPDQEGGYERGGGYDRDEEGGFERGGGYEGDPRGGYERDRWGDYEGDPEGAYHGGRDHDSDDYWTNDD